MANTISAFGFRDLGHLDGAPPTMGLERKFIFSSDTNVYFTGDVVLLSTAAAGGVGQYITVLATASVAKCYGIFRGCEYYNPSVQRTIWSNYFPGSVATSTYTNDAIAYVISDPEMTFLVQTSSNGAVASSHIGYNIGYASSVAGNTATGVSGMFVQSSNVSSIATYPFRVVDLYSNYLNDSHNLALATTATNGLDNTTGGNYIVVSFNNTNRNSGTLGGGL